MSLSTAGKSRPLPSGSVTFVMTDIEGSTRLFRELGETYVEILAMHNSLLESAIANWGGAEVGTEGDSILAAFQDASDALAACVEAQRELFGHSWPHEGELRVRMGVHTGEAKPVGDDYVALAVHQVARISSGAHGGQILVSEASARDARDHLPEGAALLELGSFHLRGFSSPERLFQLQAPDLPEVFPPLRAIGVAIHNLPYYRAAFVGRSEERVTLGELLESTGVMTIVGPGGVGKTRLAVQVGFDVMNRFADGVWLAELAPVTRPESVVRAVAAALGVADEPHRGIEDVLIGTLEPKSALLIVDNCEHVLDTAAGLIERITQHCPDIVVIATSREQLDIEGEVVWRVDPMPTVDPRRLSSLEEAASADAIRLFVERANLVRPDFKLTESNVADVAGIVAHLSGIPLAIELAAAALSEMSLAGIVGGLEDRFSLLTRGRRTAPDRHQTLRSAIEWSLDLLDPDERILFGRLSVFAGDWSTEAAVGICGHEPVPVSEVPSYLRHLARASLLAHDADSGDRWSMLESLRELASLELEEARETNAMSLRHRTWFGHRVVSLSGELGRRGRPSAQRELVADHDNIRRAHDSAVHADDADTALRISAGMLPFWTSNGDWTEGIERIGRALTLDSDDLGLRARARAGLGRLLLLSGDLAEAELSFEKARSEALGGGDDVTLARVLSGSGYVAFRHSELAEAEDRWQEALAHAEKAGDGRVTAEVLRSLAIAAGSRGEQGLAGELLERAISDAEREGDDQLLRLLLGSYAEMSLWLGRYKTAEDSYGQALVLAGEIGDISARPLLLAELGWVAMLVGNPETARRLSVEAAELAEDLHNPRVLAHSIRLHGEALLRLGELDQSALMLDRAGEVAVTLDAPAELAGVRCSQASLALERQRFDQARARAEEAIGLSALSHPMRLVTPNWILGVVELVRNHAAEAESQFQIDMEQAERMGVSRYEANALWGLAGVAGVRGQMRDAVGRYWQSLELRREIGDRLGVVESLVGLARAASDFEPVAARELIKAADLLRSEAGAVPTPLEVARVLAATEVIGASVAGGPDEVGLQEGWGEGEAVAMAERVFKSVGVTKLKTPR